MKSLVKTRQTFGQKADMTFGMKMIACITWFPFSRWTISPESNIYIYIDIYIMVSGCNLFVHPLLTTHVAGLV